MRGKECRVCRMPFKWVLRGEGEKDRYYCSLACLEKEVGEAIILPYHTPPNEFSAKFFREVLSEDSK